MSLFDRIAGIPRKGLVSGVIPESSLARDNVWVVIHDFPYFQHPERPAEKVQDEAYVTALGREIPMIQAGDGDRLHRSLRGFQNYDVMIPVSDRLSIRFQFRIDRSGDPYELISALFSIIDEAFKSAGVSFVRMRE